MTRLERALKEQETARQHLANSDRKVAVEQAKAREKARKERDKRRYRVGTGVDEAGLFALDDGTLDALIALLAPLAPLPDPVGTLEALIGVPLELAMQGVHGLPEDDDEGL